MKLKKYRVINNQYNERFSDGDAMGKERYGFKSFSCVYLIDKVTDVGDFSPTTFPYDDCVEVPDNEEMSVSVTPSFSSSNSSLLTALGDKPSKIIIEF